MKSLDFGRPALTRQTLPEEAIRAVTTLPDGVVLSGSVANVSESGALIIGDTSGLEVGSTVTVTFQYPADGRQEFDCSVVYCNFTLAPSVDSLSR